VLYLHGGGIDAPLAVTRLGLDSQPAAVTTVPHADWTGGYVDGTLLNRTAQSTCTGTSGCPVVLWQGGRNLYAFEGGDPINFRDPFGLFGVAGAVGSIVLGARGILAHFDIDINDAANGAFLPVSFHRRMHTASFHQEVTERLTAASTIEEAIEILKSLGDELRPQVRP